MKIYKHRIFARWANDEKVNDNLLIQAINEIENGLVEANLGSGLYKKRIARKGRGKREGYRTLVAYKYEDKAIFILGYGKNNLANIGIKELESLKKFSKDYLAASLEKIANAIKLSKLIEVKV